MKRSDVLRSLKDEIDGLEEYPVDGLGAYVMDFSVADATWIMTAFRSVIGYMSKGRFMTVLGWEVNAGPGIEDLQKVCEMMDLLIKAGAFHAASDYAEGTRTHESATKTINGALNEYNRSRKNHSSRMAGKADDPDPVQACGFPEDSDGDLQGPWNGKGRSPRY